MEKEKINTMTNREKMDMHKRELLLERLYRKAFRIEFGKSRRQHKIERRSLIISLRINERYERDAIIVYNYERKSRIQQVSHILGIFSLS